MNVIYVPLSQVQTNTNTYEVIVSEKAERQLKKIPMHIVLNLLTWIENIKTDGLIKTRKISGFHDEPLKGNRKGQRSIRLNKAYRAIYIIDKNGKTQIIEIIEVSKHAY